MNPSDRKLETPVACGSPTTGATSLHADLSAHSGPQSNDMVVDAAGRAFVGTIDFEGFAERSATNLLREQVGAGDLDMIACALGGDDGRTLFVCATPDFRLPPEEAARVRPARILTCRVDVPHAGRP